MSDIDETPESSEKPETPAKAPSGRKAGPGPSKAAPAKAAPKTPTAPPPSAKAEAPAAAPSTGLVRCKVVHGHYFEAKDRIASPGDIVHVPAAEAAPLIKEDVLRRA